MINRRWMLGALLFRCFGANASEQLPGAPLDLPAGGGLQTAPTKAPVDWPLSFADDFDFLDLGHWNTTFEGGKRTHGPESQVYVDPSYAGDTGHPLGLNPFSISQSVLTIKATPAGPTLAPHLERPYISGLLTTARHFQQRYGYFEIKAKLPRGHGLWPAFWLVPIDSWPPEIDVFEIIGDIPHTVYGSVHWAASGAPEDRGPGVRRDGTHLWQTLEPTVPDVFAAFHTYGALWTTDYVAFYFDDHLYGWLPTPQDMHKPMYLIINLAVGASWPGWPDKTTKFPANMQIDYVRAHILPND